MTSRPPKSRQQLHSLEEAEELTVYRIVKSDDLAAPEFLDSFRSNLALGRPPVGDEKRFPLIHDGVSVWEEAEQAIQNALTFPKLGDFVAELTIRSDAGVLYFRWGSRPGHLTIWGDALTLCQTVVDTISVQRA